MPDFIVEIIDTLPLQGATDVLRNIGIKIMFNRDISVPSLDGNIVLDQVVSDEGTPPIYSYTRLSGIITYDQRVATFTPTNPLGASSTYRVTVYGDSTGADLETTGIMDIFDNGMLGDHQYSFTTTDEPILAIPVITSPVANTTVSSVPEIIWTPVAGATSYSLQLSPATDFTVDIWDTVVTNGDTSLVPNVTLVEGPYFLRMKYEVDGQAGIVLNDAISIKVDTSGVAGNSYTCEVTAPSSEYFGFIGSGANEIAVEAIADDYTLEVVKASGGITPASATLTGTDLKITLGVDEFDALYAPYNTATLVAAAINNLTGVTATPTGDGTESVTDLASKHDFTNLGANISTTVTLSSTTLTVVLGTDADGALDDTKNTASLVAAAIDATAGISAISSDDDIIITPLSSTSFTGGSATNGTSPYSEVTRFYYDILSVPEVDEYATFDVLSTVPSNGNADIPISTSLIITFSDNVAPSTINANTLSLVSLPNTPVEITVTVTGAIVSIVAVLVGDSAYELTIKSTIASTSGIELGSDRALQFTTTYSDIWTNYQDVYNDLYPISEDIPKNIIYKAIQDAGLFAKELRTSVEAANTSLTAVDWTDATTVPIYARQYIRYQAGYNIFLNHYLGRIMDIGKLRQLGDFIIQDTGNVDRDMSKVLELLKSRYKPWLDKLMEFGYSRGYGLPKSAVRGEASYPYQAWHTRSIT